MKQFLARHRKNIILQSFISCSLFSVSVYAIIRSIFYDFPMSWTEESLFFVKMFTASQLILVTGVGGLTWMYRGLLRLKK